VNSPVNEHPTVRAHGQRPAQPKLAEPLDAAWLRQLCLDAGADDVGFVEVDRPALAEERPHIQRTFPQTRSLISFVLRMNRDNVAIPRVRSQTQNSITPATRSTMWRDASRQRWSRRDFAR
jgi:hypothetical protein